MPSSGSKNYEIEPVVIFKVCNCYRSRNNQLYLLWSMYFFNWNISGRYLTKTSKYPSSSMKKHNSSPLAGRWSLRLVNPYRHFVKPQILDEELWVCPQSFSSLHVPHKAHLAADAKVFQNLSLFKGKENRELTQETLCFPKERKCVDSKFTVPKSCVLRAVIN